MYLGFILVALGIPVFSYSLEGDLIMSALIPTFPIRIRIEERMWTDEFGYAHQRYKNSTRKLIPFLYGWDLKPKNSLQ